MISNRQDYREYIKYEKKLYCKDKNFFRIFCETITGESSIRIWKFQKWLRRAEFYHNTRKNFFHIPLFFFSMRRKNCLGEKLGISIPLNVFEKGLKIDHYGNIVINGMCKIGENCRLHGGNCIGNKGVGRIDEYPKIGKNFDLGFGAIVIGNVQLNDNVLVGANSVVTKSFNGNNIVLTGTPACLLDRGKDK